MICSTVPVECKDLVFVRKRITRVMDYARAQLWMGCSRREVDLWELSGMSPRGVNIITGQIPSYIIQEIRYLFKLKHFFFRIRNF